MELTDDYEHIQSDIIYTCENISTKDTQDDFMEILVGCECLNECTVEGNCSCLANQKNYGFDSFQNNLESIQDTFVVVKTDTPIYECNRYCKCSIYCFNRLVQYGPRKFLKIVPCNENGLINTTKKTKISDKGFGLYTTRPVQKGNFICEYAGEVISSKEANKRFELQERQKSMNYIFSVTENFSNLCLKTFVDPVKFGNIGRYINHSCNANCEVIPVRVYCTIPKLCVFAKYNIAAGCEITFDYGGGYSADSFPTSDDEDSNRKKCLCGSDNCKQFLPFSPTD